MDAIYLREVVRYRGVLVVHEGVPVSCHSLAQGASGLANVHGRAGCACDRINDIRGSTGVVPWWARQREAVTSLDEWTRLAPRGLAGMCSRLVGRAKVSRVVRTSRSFRFLERRNDTNGFWKTFRRRLVVWRVGNSLSIRACGPGSCWLHVHTRGTLLFNLVFLGLPSSFWRGIAFTAANCWSIRAAGYPRLLRKEASSLSLDSRVSGSLMMVWRRKARPYGRFWWTWGGWSLDGRRYWWVSVGFVNRSVTRCSPLIETDASRYGTDLPYENVNRISWWHSLACAMKRSSAASP